MDWKRKGLWWMEADSGHRISKAIVKGSPMYVAWEPYRSENPYGRKGFRLIACGRDSEEMKAACGY